MAKINLNEFNGEWHLINDSDDCSELIWSNGKYTLSYTNNIFDMFGAGWVVRMIKPKSGDNWSYIPGQFFAIKTNSAPWSEDRQIIFSKIFKFEDILDPSSLNIVIQERGGILLNKKFVNNVYDYQGLYNLPVIIKIAEMSTGDNVHLNCYSEDLWQDLRIKKVIRGSNDLYDEDYNFDFSALDEGVYLYGKFNQNSQGEINLYVSYQDGYGFNLNKQLQINYNLINPLTISSLENNVIINIDKSPLNSSLTQNLKDDIYYYVYSSLNLNTTFEIDWKKYDNQNLTLEKLGDNIAFTVMDVTDVNFKFKLTGGKCNVFGDITSLCSYNDKYNFKECFKDSSSIISVSNLLLPLIKLDQSCYESMFEECISLNHAFEILPAMKLTSACYKNMFKGCISLTQAPELPAIQLIESCYEGMFKDCTSLNSIIVGFEEWNQLYTLNWVENVSQNGNFKKYNKLQSLTGNSYIPSGWVVDDTKRGFTVTALIENSKVWFRHLTNNEIAKMRYKTNYSKNWMPYSSEEEISLSNKGDFVIFESTNENYSYADDYERLFQAEGEIAVSGDIQSLLNYISSCKLVFSSFFLYCQELIDASKLILSATNLSSGCYSNMFAGCVNLQYAPLQLPATYVPSYAYGNYDWGGMFSECTSLINMPLIKATYLGPEALSNMFYGCHSLVDVQQEFYFEQIQPFACRSMFEECISLSQAPKIPNIKLSAGCYSYMFTECRALVNPPELPSLQLSAGCYAYMFYGCTSLIEMPELPATSLTFACYESMFRGCTSLIEAKPLLATQLAPDCYYMMFYDCLQLNYVNVSFSSWQQYDQNYNDTGLDDYGYYEDYYSDSIVYDEEENFLYYTFTYQWLKGVSSSGTFAKPLQLQIRYDNSSIPRGWNYQNNILNKLLIPLTFISLRNESQIRVIKIGNVSDIELYRSDNGGKTYRTITYKVTDDLEKGSYWITVQKGNMISFWFKEQDKFINDNNNYYQFQLKGAFNLTGNLLSLNNFAETMGICNFSKLFLNCSGLSRFDQFKLPIPLNVSCYESMFEQCTTLTSSPLFQNNDQQQLPQSCYKNIFK